MTREEFFNFANPHHPKTCFAIVWLSSEYFTEQLSTNEEFKNKFPNLKLSLTEIFGNKLLYAETEPSTIQRGTFKNGPESYRPYILFFNKPTNSWWVMPMSSSYDFDYNKNNPSFYFVDLSVYLYFPTNIKKPEEPKYSVAMPSRAFPIAENTINFQPIDFEKRTVNKKIIEYINEKFICNEYFKDLAYSKSSINYITSTGKKTFTTNARFGFFLLNFLRANCDIMAKKMCDLHTTTTSINKLENYLINYQTLCEYTEQLENAVSDYIIAKSQLEKIKEKYQFPLLVKDEKTDKQLKEVIKICAAASSSMKTSLNNLEKILPNINNCLVNMKFDNFSKFSYNMDYANQFVESLDKSDSVHVYVSSALKEHMQVIENQIVNLKQKHNNAQKIKAQIIMEEKQQEEQKKRILQSEKDKAKAQKQKITIAIQKLEELKAMHYANTIFNWQKYIQNIKNLSNLQNRIEQTYNFLDKENQNVINNIISSKVKNLEPYCKNEMKELKEIANAMQASIPDELAEQIKELIIQKNIKQENINENIISLLNDEEKTNALKQELRTVNETTLFIDEVMSNSPSMSEQWKFKSDIINEKVNTLQDLKYNNTLK